MKYLLIAMLAIFPGCTANFVMRGNLANYQQKADTEGKIRNDPWSGDSTVAAEKTTDAKMDLPIK